MTLEAQHIALYNVLKFIHYANKHLTKEKQTELMKIYIKFSKEDYEQEK